MQYLNIHIYISACLVHVLWIICQTATEVLISRRIPKPPTTSNSADFVSKVKSLALSFSTIFIQSWPPDFLGNVAISPRSPGPYTRWSPLWVVSLSLLSLSGLGGASLAARVTGARRGARPGLLLLSVEWRISEGYEVLLQITQDIYTQRVITDISTVVWHTAMRIVRTLVHSEFWPS